MSTPKKAEDVLTFCKTKFTPSIDNISHLHTSLSTLNEQEWDYIFSNFSLINNDHLKIIIYTTYLGIYPTIKCFNECFSLLKDSEYFSWDEKYFLRWQLMGILFCSGKTGDYDTSFLQYDLYQKIYIDFKKKFNNIKKITTRNPDLVFVTTQQFLSLEHAPTKTTLDRAYILKKVLKKQVIIINTAEQYGGKKIALPYIKSASYNNNLPQNIVYNDTTIPYMQFDPNMPNIENCSEFIDFISKYKPSYIVNIGGNSLLVDLCNEFIPVLNVNTVFSSLSYSKAFIQTIGKTLDTNDINFLHHMNKNIDNVIEGRFTFWLKPQQCTYTRAQFNLNENTFIMAVIGGRLTTEITEEFIKTLHPAFKEGALLFIIGTMDSYEKFCLNDILFAEHSIYLGFQDDVLALLELCDLYVNPKRSGGGSSVVEAMYKGCPAVSLNIGDVSVSAGPDFCVNSYNEMSEKILQYMFDKDYYKTMSQKAIKRANYNLDSTSAFTEIITEFEKRIENW